MRGCVTWLFAAVRFRMQKSLEEAARKPKKCPRRVARSKRLMSSEVASEATAQPERGTHVAQATAQPERLSNLAHVVRRCETCAAPLRGSTAVGAHCSECRPPSRFMCPFCSARFNTIGYLGLHIDTCARRGTYTVHVYYHGGNKKTKPCIPAHVHVHVNQD